MDRKTNGDYKCVKEGYYTRDVFSVKAHTVVGFEIKQFSSDLRRYEEVGCQQLTEVDVAQQLLEI